MDSKDISSWLEELLPEIPNDIALDMIATKLSWQRVHALSLLSPSWQQAIESGVVYDARVRCHSRETLAVLWTPYTQCGRVINGLSLYSLRHKTICQLPPLPEFIKMFELVALDDKVYVLGGTNWSFDKEDFRQVHVLDLSGPWQWKQCASMLEPRTRFQCAVKDGKIYVFGGGSVNHALREDCLRSEVYDPKVDTWFPIEPKKFPGRYQSGRVTAVGEELFMACQSGLQYSWQVYHPLNNEWRGLEPFRKRSRFLNNIFMKQGKFYSVGCDGIDVYDTRMDSWIHWCSISCHELGPVTFSPISAGKIFPADNELLVVVSWHSPDDGTAGSCFLQSNGFGSGNNEVVWSKVPYFIEPCACCGPLMCLIQL